MLAPEVEERLTGISAVDGLDRFREVNGVGVEGLRRRHELVVAAAEGRARRRTSEEDVLLELGRERRTKRRAGSVNVALELVRELLGDAPSEDSRRHRHVAGSDAQLVEGRRVFGCLGVDGSEERLDVRLQFVGHRLLRKVGIGGSDERTEVCAVAIQVLAGLLDLRGIVCRLARGVVHEEADVLAPEVEERLTGISAVDGLDRFREVNGVGVEGLRRRHELVVAAAEGRARRRTSEEDVLLELGREQRTELSSARLCGEAGGGATSR